MKTIWICMALGVLFVASPKLRAQYTLQYSTNGTEITLESFSGTPVNVAIPNGVTSIGQGAFDGCTSLISIMIPDTVNTIGISAFQFCTSLTGITIPNSVTNLGAQAFYLCSDLASVTIGSGVTSLGIYTFANCPSLAGITIPANVTNMESRAFIDCSSLTNIFFEGNAPGGVDLTVFTADPTNLTAYYLPGTTGWANFSAFTGIPAALLYTLYYSTNGSAITLEGYTGTPLNLIIPNGVTAIASGAFTNCSSLISVTLPGSVTNLGDYAFSACTNLTSVYFASNAPSVDSTVFAGDPAGLAVYYLYGTTGWNAFAADCGVALFTINGFAGSPGNVTIPNFVTGIGQGAFSDCVTLTSVTIPNSITNIGDSAFSYCAGLTSVYFESNAPSVDSTVFADDAANLTVYYLYGTTGWGPFATNSGIAFFTINGFTGSPGNVTIPNFVTGIGQGAFSDCLTLTSVTIGNEVTSIGNDAFQGCFDLNSANLGSSVTSIGADAFAQGGMNSIIIPNSVTNIGAGAFSDTALQSVSLGDSVISIGAGAFEADFGLTGITVPNTVTTIGNGAFEDDYGLSGVTIGNSVTSLGDDAFENCRALALVFLEGNAPIADPTVFNGAAANLTAYYLYGTTGWNAFSADTGITALLLNPPISTSTNFGVRNKQFGFTITAPTNTTVVVEGCTNLLNPAWTPVQTNTLAAGSTNFSDASWTNSRARYYRVEYSLP